MMLPFIFSPKKAQFLEDEVIFFSDKMYSPLGLNKVKSALFPISIVEEGKEKRFFAPVSSFTAFSILVC